jgi:hypothetical protein
MSVGTRRPVVMVITALALFVLSVAGCGGSSGTGAVPKLYLLSSNYDACAAKCSKTQEREILRAACATAIGPSEGEKKTHERLCGDLTALENSQKAEAEQQAQRQKEARSAEASAGHTPEEERLHNESLKRREQIARQYEQAENAHKPELEYVQRTREKVCYERGESQAECNSPAKRGAEEEQSARKREEQIAEERQRYHRSGSECVGIVGGGC